MTIANVDLVYLGSSGLEVAPPSDDLSGLAMVGPDGLRIGEVDDVVLDLADRRARLISVASGGILGFARRRALVPVEVVTKVDDRVHVVLSYDDVFAGPGGPSERSTTDADRVTAAEAEATYDAYGVVPFWKVGRSTR